jgi:hypothetical protein
MCVQFLAGAGVGLYYVQNGFVGDRVLFTRAEKCLVYTADVKNAYNSSILFICRNGMVQRVFFIA